MWMFNDVHVVSCHLRATARCSHALVKPLVFPRWGCPALLSGGKVSRCRFECHPLHRWEIGGMMGGSKSDLGVPWNYQGDFVGEWWVIILPIDYDIPGWWQLKYFFYVQPENWGIFSSWRIFFRWVETTNQKMLDNKKDMLKIDT